MAAFMLSSTYVGLNGSDYSAHAKACTLTVEVADLDTTDFASSGWKEVIGGLKSGTLDITWNQDVAAAAIDSVIWPLLGTVVTFEVRATSAAVGASNPKYTGSVLINGWTPLDGNVGDLAETDSSFPVTGTVTRAIA